MTDRTISAVLIERHQLAYRREGLKRALEIANQFTDNGGTASEVALSIQVEIDNIKFPPMPE